MNPQGQDRLPSLELPKPLTDQATQGAEALPFVSPLERDNAVAVERGVGVTGPGVPLPVIPPAQTNAIPVAPVQTNTVTQPAAPSGTPQIADDADLIEKEWVEKAKQIVEQTKNDPHLQNSELNKIKADYMKKRYNKDIKLQD